MAAGDTDASAHLIASTSTGKVFIISTNAQTEGVVVIAFCSVTGQPLKAGAYESEPSAINDIKAQHGPITETHRAEAIAGLIRTGNCVRLLLITQVNRLLHHDDHVVCVVTETAWLKINLPDAVELDETGELIWEQIHSIPFQHRHFYCETLDLTSPYQGRPKGLQHGSMIPMISMHRPQASSVQYWWNERLCQPFASAGLADICCTLLCGTVSARSVTLNSGGARLSMMLMCRRNRESLGGWFVQRGLLDDRTAVANTSECDFIMWVAPCSYSHHHPHYAPHLGRRSTTTRATQVPFQSFSWIRSCAPVDYNEDESLVDGVELAISNMMFAAPVSSVSSTPQTAKSSVEGHDRSGDYLLGLCERFQTNRLLTISLLSDMEVLGRRLRARMEVAFAELIANHGGSYRLLQSNWASMSAVAVADGEKSLNGIHAAQQPMWDLACHVSTLLTLSSGGQWPVTTVIGSSRLDISSTANEALPFHPEIESMRISNSNLTGTGDTKRQQETFVVVCETGCSDASVLFGRYLVMHLTVRATRELSQHAASVPGVDLHRASLSKEIFHSSPVRDHLLHQRFSPATLAAQLLTAQFESSRGRQKFDSIVSSQGMRSEIADPLWRCLIEFGVMDRALVREWYGCSGTLLNAFGVYATNFDVAKRRLAQLWPSPSLAPGNAPVSRVSVANNNNGNNAPLSIPKSYRARFSSTGEELGSTSPRLRTSTSNDRLNEDSFDAVTQQVLDSWAEGSIDVLHDGAEGLNNTNDLASVRPSLVSTHREVLRQRAALFTGIFEPHALTLPASSALEFSPVDIQGCSLNFVDGTPTPTVPPFALGASCPMMVCDGTSADDEQVSVTVLLALHSHAVIDGVGLWIRHGMNSLTPPQRMSVSVGAFRNQMTPVWGLGAAFSHAKDKSSADALSAFASTSSIAYTSCAGRLPLAPNGTFLRFNIDYSSAKQLQCGMALYESHHDAAMTALSRFVSVTLYGGFEMTLGGLAVFGSVPGASSASIWRRKVIDVDNAQSRVSKLAMSTAMNLSSKQKFDATLRTYRPQSKDQRAESVAAALCVQRVSDQAKSATHAAHLEAYSKVLVTATREPQIKTFLGVLELEKQRLRLHISCAERDQLAVDLKINPLMLNPSVFIQIPMSVRNPKTSLSSRLEFCGRSLCNAPLAPNAPLCRVCMRRYCLSCLHVEVIRVPYFRGSLPLSVCMSCYDKVTKETQLLEEVRALSQEVAFDTYRTSELHQQRSRQVSAEVDGSWERFCFALGLQLGSSISTGFSGLGMTTTRQHKQSFTSHDGVALSDVSESDDMVVLGHFPVATLVDELPQCGPDNSPLCIFAAPGALPRNVVWHSGLAEVSIVLVLATTACVCRVEFVLSPECVGQLATCQVYGGDLLSNLSLFGQYSCLPAQNNTEALQNQLTSAQSTAGGRVLAIEPHSSGRLLSLKLRAVEGCCVSLSRLMVFGRSHGAELMNSQRVQGSPSKTHALPLSEPVVSAPAQKRVRAVTAWEPNRVLCFTMETPCLVNGISLTPRRKGYDAQVRSIHVYVCGPLQNVEQRAVLMAVFEVPLCVEGMTLNFELAVPTPLATLHIVPVKYYGVAVNASYDAHLY